MSNPLHRRLVLLLASGLVVVGLSACAQETDGESRSPQGELDDEGAEQEDPMAEVDEPGGENDASPQGGDRDFDGEVGDAESGPELGD